jgi:ribonucleoside-diphosphate reductase alpha chain
MGFQDALFAQRIPYGSRPAMIFADQSMEAISYYAILASTDLARQRGTYCTYSGSKWDRGLLPIDTLDLLAQSRGGDMEVDRSATMDWQIVRIAVREYGLRNSNVLAIAPTATISNIAGCTQSIEPIYRNLFAKSNLSGDFTISNLHLVADLKSLGLWDQRMIDDIKYYDGSIQSIERIPQSIRDLYRTAFEINPEWIIEAAARRQKWLDMGQSLNLYLDRPSGQALHDMYFLAWRKGLKTTYYLRGQAATQVEKSSLDINRHGIQPRWMKNTSASARVQAVPEPIADQGADQPAGGEVADIPACLLENPGCEACQ